MSDMTEHVRNCSEEFGDSFRTSASELVPFRPVIVLRGRTYTELATAQIQTPLCPSEHFMQVRGSCGVTNA